MSRKNKRKIYIKNYKRKKTKVAIENFLIIFLAVTFVTLFLVFLKNLQINKKTSNAKVDILVENVERLNIPIKTLETLWTLSEENNKDFTEVFVIYSLENDFFPSKSLDEVETVESIKYNFFGNYTELRKLYTDKKIKKYYSVFNNIFNEVKEFPVPSEYAGQYMFGDSYSVLSGENGDYTHRGTDIVDRNNIVGTIPVLSMTDGVVSKIGWNEKNGNEIIISTENNNYIYSNLDRFDVSLLVGQNVAAGQLLGYMGNTGAGKNPGDVGTYVTHLHLEIEANSQLAKDNLKLNPYPILRLLENNKLNGGV